MRQAETRPGDEDGEFRHSIARLLSVGLPPSDPRRYSHERSVCRADSLSCSHDFYQKTECYGNSCQYDIHQCALLHVEPPFFMAFFPKSKLSSSCLPDAVTHPLSGLLQAYLCAQRTLMSIQKPQCQRPFQPSIQIMIQYSSVMEKFFIIAMKTLGFLASSLPMVTGAVYTRRFLINSVKNRLSSPLLYFAPPPNNRENVIPDRSRLSLRTAKLDCAIPPAIIPTYRFPFRITVGAAFFLHLNIENDHIGPGIPFKLRKNSRLITIFIHNIRIRKKADVSFRPKDGLIAASADATIGKTAETDSSVPRRYLHFLLPQPVALIDDHRIRLQVHMLYGLRKRSIHYRCQNFYLHACSPPCSVFCVCMAPGRK